MPRSTKTKEIIVHKVRGLGSEYPGFMPLLHRHFEKAKPTVASAKEATIIAPVDLLNLLVPPVLLDEIEAIEIHYKKVV